MPLYRCDSINEPKTFVNLYGPNLRIAISIIISTEAKKNAEQVDKRCGTFLSTLPIDEVLEWCPSKLKVQNERFL